MSPCDCHDWKGYDPNATHHPACHFSDELAPSADGSCHCGCTVISTDMEPCYWCGGYTLPQLRRARLEAEVRS